MATSNINPLECSICLENFQNPRLISCHHSFCFNCLDDFIKNTSKNNKFNCPVCRKEVEVPPGGVADFSVNFYINTLKVETNPENRMTKSPKLTAEGLPGNVKEDEKHFCEKHPKKEVEFFCVDCQVVACSKCSVSTHKTHELLDLDEEETRQIFLMELSQIKSKLEDKDEQNNQLIKTVNMIVTDISGQGEREIQKISDHVDLICASIRRKGKASVKEIRNHVSLSKKKLKETTSGIKRCPASLKDDIVNTLKNESSVVNLINTTHRTQGLFSTLNKTEVHPSFKNVEFVMSDESQNMVGHIKYSNPLVMIKLNMKIFGPDLKKEEHYIKFEKRYTYKNFSWSLLIRKSYSTLRFYLIQNDPLDNMPGAHSIPKARNITDLRLKELCSKLTAEHSIPNDEVPNYTITLLNLKDQLRSISRSFNDRYQTVWEFLHWDQFIDSTNGFIDENQDFYVKITFP